MESQNQKSTLHTSLNLVWYIKTHWQSEWISHAVELQNTIDYSQSLSTMRHQIYTALWTLKRYKMTIDVPNISLMSLALSPMYLSTIALDTTLRKLASNCFETALARRVFPVPGAPYRRQPLGGVIPTRPNNSGLSRGSSITCQICTVDTFS